MNNFPSLDYNALAAELSDSLRRLTRSGMAQKAERGEFPGRAPLGYRNVRTRRGAHIVIDPETAPIVREAFRLAAGGRAVRHVHERLANSGLVARQERPFSPLRLRHMLMNPFYVGMFRFRNRLFQGAHQPLVSSRVFNAAQHSLRKRGNPSQRDEIRSK